MWLQPIDIDVYIQKPDYQSQDNKLFQRTLYRRILVCRVCTVMRMMFNLIDKMSTNPRRLTRTILVPSRNAPRCSVGTIDDADDRFRTLSRVASFDYSANDCWDKLWAWDGKGFPLGPLCSPLATTPPPPPPPAFATWHQIRPDFAQNTDQSRWQWWLKARFWLMVTERHSTTTTEWFIHHNNTVSPSQLMPQVKLVI